MWHTRVATTCIGASFWLGAGFIATPDAVAQASPGYRIRMPIGGSLGAPVRPQRLTGTTPSTLDPFGQRRSQSFIPYSPFGYYLGSDAYVYPDDTTGEAYSSDTQRVPVQPARDVYPVYDTVPPVGPLQVSAILVGTRTMLRLTWRDGGLGAKQVAFFLADSLRRVVRAQTVRSPPFTALIEPPSGTAYAGMTVMLPGGALETQYVPYHRRAR